VVFHVTYSQSASNLGTKRGGVAFRTDDNQQISKYLEYASIFNKYNQKFTFAINLGLSTITTDYITGINQLRASGHEMMDHTPQHRTNLFRTMLNPDYFIGHPGVHAINGNSIMLKHAPVDISKSKRNGYANINGNIVSVSNGIFSSFSKFDCYLYFPSLNQLVYINEYSGGWIDSNTVKVQDVWTQNVNLGVYQNIKFYNFDVNNVHITSDAINVLAEESLRLASYYGLERPYVWIQPGGNHPQVYSNEVKEGLSGILGYKAAGTFNGTSLKVFNEYNPSNDRQFGMSWGDFREESSTLDDCKKTIADRVAKHHVVFGASHFQSTLGGWSGFLDRTDKLIQWCSANNIPIRTYSEWSDILYRQTPDPYENIFPPLNIDLDGNNKPDGYNSNVGGILDKTDGYPSASDYCFSTNKAGWIFSIGDLAGIEKGQNDFEIWTKGAPGNFIEVIFQLKTSFWSGTQDFVYKFPAENSEWTYYNLAQSINGNTSLNIPQNVSLMNVIVQCSNYSSGQVKISGMKFAKYLATGDYLSVSPSNQAVVRTSGNTSFSVASNINWTASENESWLTIEPANGTNNGSITANFTENTSTSQRVGAITVAGAGLTRTITITQAGVPITLTVTPSDRPVTYSAGSTTFSVTSNTSWSVTDNADWLTITPSSGSNNGTITANFLENASTNQKVGTLTISGGGITKAATVTQAGIPAALSVSPSDRSVTYSSGSTTFSVTSNTSWSVTDNADWLTITPSSGSNNGTITANFLENASTNQRVGTLTINGGGITKTATVTQESTPFLSVEPTNRKVGYSSGNTTFSVTANRSWTVSDDADWIILSSLNGVGNDTIYVAYEENKTFIQRIANITFNMEGITKTVTVTQRSVPMLDVSPSEHNIANSGGNVTFAITSNRSWTVEENLEWLTVIPMSGTNDGVLELTAAENRDTTERTGEIKIYGEGIVRTAAINQTAAPYLVITPTEHNIANGGGTTTFTVTSNRGWTVTDDAEWITVEPEFGSNTQTVLASFEVNTNPYERVGTISVNADTMTAAISITQAAANSLTVSPVFLELPANMGTAKLIINSNISWHISEEANWLSLDIYNGSNIDTINLYHIANDRIISRSCKITVAGENILIELNVTQMPGNPRLHITPNGKVVDANAGKINVSIETNAAWKILNEHDWITVEPDSGEDNSEIVISYTANKDSLLRSVFLYFIADSITNQFALDQNGLEVFDILAYPESDTSGTTLGSGRYLLGSLASIAAVPNIGWIFKSWKESDQQVSTDSVYSFEVTCSRNLAAVFEKITTDLSEDNITAKNFELFQNYPNPFNPSTKIRFAIPKSTKVTIQIYNQLGELIGEPVHDFYDQGFYEVEINLRDLASGVYFYKIIAGSFFNVKKMVLNK
jgi:hypothetical protein